MKQSEIFFNIDDLHNLVVLLCKDICNTVDSK